MRAADAIAIICMQDNRIVDILLREPCQKSIHDQFWLVKTDTNFAIVPLRVIYWQEGYSLVDPMIV